MGPLPGETAAQRLQLALELHDLGMSMYRARLHREQPEATEEDLDEQVRAWLRRRPSGEVGDMPGQASTRRL
ncbi:MAG: hypothetical protein ACT4QF_00110 [Sporichthyaceae bacterium]|jgi:hypothetical protein